MRGNNIETYKRKDGKWAWRITAKRGNLPDAIIATDGNQGYENESDAIAGLMSVFFGTYDTSFLAAHKKWAALNGDAPEVYIRQQVPVEEAAPEAYTEAE